MIWFTGWWWEAERQVGGGWAILQDQTDQVCREATACSPQGQAGPPRTPSTWGGRLGLRVASDQEEPMSRGSWESPREMTEQMSNGWVRMEVEKRTVRQELPVQGFKSPGQVQGGLGQVSLGRCEGARWGLAQESGEAGFQGEGTEVRHDAAGEGNSPGNAPRTALGRQRPGCRDPRNQQGRGAGGGCQRRVRGSWEPGWGHIYKGPKCQPVHTGDLHNNVSGH